MRPEKWGRNRRAIRPGRNRERKGKAIRAENGEGTGEPLDQRNKERKRSALRQRNEGGRG